MKFDFSKAKQNMIDCQIRPFSVIDEGVINAFDTVARENFVTNDQRFFAYTDDSLDLGQGRLLMDAAIFARLLQELKVMQGDQVLDLGCGSGYSSMILSSLGASVTGVDTSRWIEKSKENTTSTTVKSPRWVAVDNPVRGCAQYGPYDGIVINSSIGTPPTHLVDQLRDGGKIATIYRDAKGQSQAVLFVKQGDALICQPLFDAFVPALPDFQAETGFVF